MKLIQYHEDANGNRWDADKFSESQAEILSKTLLNCTNCTDCSYCIGCEDCFNCKYLDHCSQCKNCENGTSIRNFNDYKYEDSVGHIRRDIEAELDKVQNHEK